MAPKRVDLSSIQPYPGAPWNVALANGAPTTPTYPTVPRLPSVGTSPLNIGTGGSPMGGSSAFASGPPTTPTDSSPSSGSDGSGGGIDWGSIFKWALKVAPVALGAYSAYTGSKQAASGQALQDQALQLAMQKYADLAPLRAVGLSALSNATSHPVSPLEAVGGYVDTGNPYTRTPSSTPVSTAFTPTAAPTPQTSPVLQAALDPTLGTRLGGVTPLLGPTRTAKRRIS